MSKHNSTNGEVETLTDVQAEIENLTSVKTQKQFKVVLFNDEDHSYDYVVELLTKVCKLTREQAFRCAVEVDMTGRTIVFYGDKDKCTEVSHQINDYGPDYRMPRSLGSMESAVEGF